MADDYAEELHDEGACDPDTCPYCQRSAEQELLEEAKGAQQEDKELMEREDG